mmetsp:Transcript_41978/g.108757  ORF Transcript_41978/g.108757 Transcript_41978/m.108757 type:complete len:525 (+) Transcript_41978:60-1634(+)
MAGKQSMPRPILAILLVCGALACLSNLTFVGIGVSTESLEPSGGSKAVSVESIVGAAAIIVLIARAKDVQHISRLFFDPGSSNPQKILMTLASALAIMVFEQLVGKVLKALGLAKLPTTLMGQIMLFVLLRGTQKAFGRETSDKIAEVFNPGVEFLGKNMGLFLAPPLVSLDASIRRLPAYSGGVWAKTVGLLVGCWGVQHGVVGAVASMFVKGRAPPAPAGAKKAAAAAAATAPKLGGAIPQEEALRRAWVILGALGYLGVAVAPRVAPGLQRPCAMLAELSTTIASMAYGKLLPEAAQRILHPMVVCAVVTNISTRFVGPAAPYFDEGRGVGDFLFRWLGPAVVGLGVRMYQNTPLWLDNAEDFMCVMGACSVSAVWNLIMMTFVGLYELSPFSVPAPLALPMVHRSVMSALGIANSVAIGPECDPKLAVASILITGCIGASLGSTLLKSAPKIFNRDWPLVRGITMGCSAHSLGTAALISEQDPQAAAISGAAMCINGAVHTALIAIPLVRTTLRALAHLE